MKRCPWTSIAISSLSLAVVAAIGGCKTGGAVESATLNTPTQPDGPSSIEHDPELGESIWPGEEAATQGISANLQAAVKAHHQSSGKARRDAHPKAHGCVLAEFKVNETLSANLQHGVFQPGASYPAWIRFSNGDSDPDRADGKGDGRGMAIKLMNVPGQKLLDDEQGTQDFVMINHPVFFINDPKKYLDLTTALGSSNPLVKLGAPGALGFEGSAIAAAILLKKIANPLTTRYWSMVPYQLGTGDDRQVMKYSAKPCMASSNIPSPVQLLDKNYLSKSMKKTLDNGGACFEFLVQARDPRTVGADALGIESSTTEWSESEAPFVKVATVTIKKQQFSSTAQQNFCENLSFTPWHAVADHRPLGGVNRIRRVVYKEISTLRRGLNHVTATEPTGNETF